MLSWTRRVSVAGVAALLVVAAVSCRWAAPVSVDEGGTQWDATDPALSADGRFVAFATMAPLLAEDTNGAFDVYRRDLQTGTTARISVDADGGQLDAPSASPAISADGHRVAFTTRAEVLPGVSNGKSDVYLRDLGTGDITRVSVTDGGGDLGLDAFAQGMDADGSTVAFTGVYEFEELRSTNLYVRDLDTGTTTSVGVSGDESTGDLSADGEWAAFSVAVAEFPHPDDNIYLRHVPTGTLTLLGVTPTGQRAEHVSSPWVSVSGDGRYAAFTTDAGDLVADDGNGLEDVFVRDVVAGTTERISVDVDGGDPDGGSRYAQISDDGRFVAFHSQATDLVAQDVGDQGAVFVWDRQEARIEVVSVDLLGRPTVRPYDRGPNSSEISGDGTVVAFVADGGIHARQTTHPVIDSVTPATVPRGTTSWVTVEGRGFRPAVSVRVPLDGVEVTDLVVVDEHQLAVRLDVAADAPLGTGDVWVVDPAPGPGEFGIGASIDVAKGAITVT